LGGPIFLAHTEACTHVGAQLQPRRTEIAGYQDQGRERQSRNYPVVGSQAATHPREQQARCAEYEPEQHARPRRANPHGSWHEQAAQGPAEAHCKAESSWSRGTSTHDETERRAAAQAEQQPTAAGKSDLQPVDLSLQTRSPLASPSHGHDRPNRHDAGHRGSSGRRHRKPGRAGLSPTAR